MAKSRRKANGCKRGTFKRKRMGKGWLVAQTPPSKPSPTAGKAKDAESSSASESADSN